MKSITDSKLKIDIRKLLGEPKWVFFQAIYSRVVVLVTHFAIDRMERIKMTVPYSSLDSPGLT